MSDESTKIIEINGVKFEVDSRNATLRQIDKIQIGSRVKVLLKQYDGYKVHYGVVIGFEPFTELPTIIVAYLDGIHYSSNTPEIKFLYFNAKSTEQIVISSEEDKEALHASNVIAQLDRAVEKKKIEIQDIEDKKQYFLNNFQSYWQPLSLAETTK